MSLEELILASSGGDARVVSDGVVEELAVMDPNANVMIEARLLERGQLLGDYEILAAAGAGGMGVVYQARQQSLGRIVALKVIREEITSVPEYRERFLREARLAASVDHPHVVSVHDVGESDRWLYLVMQWIDGHDLKQLLATTGRLDPDRAVTIAIQVAGALDAVHGVAGLVHRDVKPANVLWRELGQNDHAYLTDFGVAKPSETTDQLTQTGWVVGTSGYLSPEQIRGQEPGPRSDLYALGCLFYETLTGRPPFTAHNDLALRWAHANDPRPLVSSAVPDLGPRYDRFVAIALSLDPAERFASGREFAEMLAMTHDGREQARPATSEPVAATHPPTAVGPPTPMPPAIQTPLPTPPPGHPAYGYPTPAPTYTEKPRSGNPLALILLAVIALAGIAAGALAAAGIFSPQASTRTVATPAATHHAKQLKRTRSVAAASTGRGAVSHTARTSPTNSQAPSAPPAQSSSSVPSDTQNLASPDAPPVGSAAGGALQAYWTLVNTGHYVDAWTMETPHEQGQEPSFLSDKRTQQPMINVVSIGQPSSSSGTAEVPIAFYALDRYPTSTNDTTCTYFQMTANMIQGADGSWFYDGPVPGTAQVTKEPGSSNCHS
jgi:serine/threonine protein kinase